MVNSSRWKLGMQGEEVVRRWLKDQGFLVIPASLIQSGGAPMLQGWLQQFVLPDNQAFKDGQGRWVEVKTKSRATFYLKTKIWEHGLKTKNWEDYLAVQSQTGMAAWLCILELESSLVLLATMDQLAKRARRYIGTAMPDGQPHIFFPRDAFEWYTEPRAITIQPITPMAPRTVTQPQAPTTRQFELF